MTCKKCAGTGWVRYTYPSNKPKPCHWFTTGAVTCDACKGEGEI